MLRKKAQSMLEYLIVFTAVIAGVIAGVAYFAGQDTGIGKLMNKSGEKIENSSDMLKGVINR